MSPRRQTERSIRKTTTAPRDRAWQAMRAYQKSQGGFTIPEIQVASDYKNRQGLTKYLKGLRRCGYIVMARKKDALRGRPAEFRLVRDTGPFRPWLQSNKVVYDRNLAQEFMPTVEVSDGAW
jgi:hypothetical protein